MNIFPGKSGLSCSSGFIQQAKTIKTKMVSARMVLVLLLLLLHFFRIIRQEYQQNLYLW